LNTNKEIKLPSLNIQFPAVFFGCLVMAFHPLIGFALGAVDGATTVVDEALGVVAKAGTGTPLSHAWNSVVFPEALTLSLIWVGAAIVVLPTAIFAWTLVVELILSVRRITEASLAEPVAVSPVSRFSLSSLREAKK
jgi:hypothetical protein